MPDINLGYHAGDLGKAEGFFSITCGGRHTGHFGTGTYFVGDEEELKYGEYRDRPRETVDFSKYNLYRPGTVFARSAFEFLKNLNTYILDMDHPIQDSLTVFTLIRQAESLVWDYEVKTEEDPAAAKKLSEELDRIFSMTLGEETLAHQKERYPDKLWYVYESLAKDLNRDGSESFKDRTLARIFWFQYAPENAQLYFDVPAGKVPGILRDVYERTTAMMDKRLSNEAKYADGPSTMFMKALGYEGVDVRFIPGMDNTAYGSVIYDLKGPDAERRAAILAAREKKPSLADRLADADNRRKETMPPVTPARSIQCAPLDK